MTNEDFEFCEFIVSDMCYLTYQDFCKKRRVIKRIYKDLSPYQKRFYKWYVYANINMRETYKNAIWEYLNFNQKEYALNLMHLLALLKK